MTAPTPSVTPGLREASDAAKARADAAYTGIAGIERADDDKADENARIAAFVAAIERAVPRKVAVDDGAMVNRTYRLPVPPTLSTATPEQLARFEAWLATEEASFDPVAADRVIVEPAVHDMPLPLDYDATAQTTRAGLEPDTPDAPGDQVAADWLTDPVEVREHPSLPDTYRAVCRLCPPMTAHCRDTGSPGTARAAMAGHLRREHNRSPWPGSA